MTNLMRSPQGVKTGVNYPLRITPLADLVTVRVSEKKNLRVMDYPGRPLIADDPEYEPSERYPFWFTLDPARYRGNTGDVAKITVNEMVNQGACACERAHVQNPCCLLPVADGALLRNEWSRRAF